MIETRPSRLAAAMVIARRDFTAILFKKSFLFFLLSPFFPVIVSMIAGGIGSEVRKSTDRPELGLAMQPADIEAMERAHRELAPNLGTMPELTVVKRLSPGETFDPREAMAAARSKGNLAAVLSGTPAAPMLTGPEERISRWQGPVALLAARASGLDTTPIPHVALTQTAGSRADTRRNQAFTAQSAQTVLFLLMMLLAGMVLSNLVEEKGNKIIEILAAAVPMDAVFLGKLFAMLGVSLVGIAVWTSAAGAFILFAGPALPGLAEPAVGWPMFVALGVVYFALGYLLIGAVFLAVGAMAPTVRDVQSLSMPASMIQLLLFLFATYAVTQPGSWMEIAAAVLPFSSPFAMLARAAQDAAIWPHLLAITWQVVCVTLFVRTGARLFRTWVMKSGSGGTGRQKRGLFARLRPARA